MTNPTRSLIILSIAFVIAVAVVFYMNLQIAAEQTFLRYNLISLGCLVTVFGIFLFLFSKEGDNAKKDQEQLKLEIDNITDSLNDAQSRLDNAVEKKTFEMSVINGSLNREIAERIQAETEGTKLRKRLHAILDSAGDGIFGIDNNGMVTFVNHKATELLGWTKDELIGTSHHDLVHHTRKSGGNFPVEECPIYKAYKDGHVHSENDDIFWTKAGNSFPVEYTSTPLLDGDKNNGAVVVFKDISESKKLQKQQDLILDSAGEGIFGLDETGKVTFMNRAATIMLGWEQDELIGKSHHELVHHSHSDGSKYHENDCPIYMACTDGEVHFNSDDIFWTKNGTSFNVEYSSTPIFEGEKVTGAVVMFRDLTTFS